MQFCKTYNLANENVIGTFAILLGMALLSSMPVRAAEADALTTDNELPAITMIPGDGMNLEITEQISSHYVVVKVNPPVHNWFAGTFTNLPTDKQVTTIGLSMEGMDTTGNKADVTKWRGLMPVMTYADPTKYETYEWFMKDEQGRWVSGDPFKQGETKYAGTGKVPEQSVIPANIAEQFLDKTGTYWQPWREVDQAEVVPLLNIFRVRQKFSQPIATVAMRVPYTYSYLSEYITRLNRARINNLTIKTIGLTTSLRKVFLIDIGSNGETSSAGKDIPTILFYAREHATEPDSSWCINGIINGVIKQQQLHMPRCHILLIPCIDPDGAVECQYDRITEAFSPRPLPPNEIIGAANFLSTFVIDSHNIDIAISLHNVEANEINGHIMCPYRSEVMATAQSELLDTVFRSLKDYQAINPRNNWGYAYRPLRLNGWCNRLFGTMDVILEVNGRWPSNRLTIAGIEDLGSAILRGSIQYINSNAYDQLCNTAHERANAYRTTIQESSTFYSRIPGKLLNDLFIKGIPNDPVYSDRL